MSIKKRFHGERGMTLPEILLALMIFLVIIFEGSNLWTKFTTAIVRTRVRNELLLESTTGLDSIVRYLSQASWNTVVVWGRPGAAAIYPWSNITFSVVQPDQSLLRYSFSQTAANELTMTVGTAAPQILTHNVATLIFNYPRANDPSLMIVTLGAQKVSGSNFVESVSRSVQVKLLSPMGT